jgi:hypothetical protein
MCPRRCACCVATLAWVSGSGGAYPARDGPSRNTVQGEAP